MRKGRGRRRVYCGDACRNVAYVERKEPPTDKRICRGLEAEGTRFDEIIDPSAVLGPFMDELLLRIAVRSLLERLPVRGVNQLIVIFFMIGRMTEGDYRLPCVVS